MSKISKMVAVLAVMGTLAPLAAQAGNDGMYQPNPVITHSQNQQQFPAGRTAHAQQVQALNRTTQPARSAG